MDGRALDVRDLAERLLGPIETIAHQPPGHAGVTFAIRTAAGEYILKTRDEPGVFDHWFFLSRDSTHMTSTTGRPSDSSEHALYR